MKKANIMASFDSSGGFIGQFLSSVLGLNLFGEAPSSSSVVENSSEVVARSRETRQADRAGGGPDLYGAASGGYIIYFSLIS